MYVLKVEDLMKGQVFFHESDSISYETRVPEEEFSEEFKSASVIFSYGTKTKFSNLYCFLLKNYGQADKNVFVYNHCKFTISYDGKIIERQTINF